MKCPIPGPPRGPRLLHFSLSSLPLSHSPASTMAEAEEQPPTLFHEVRSNKVVSQKDGESTLRIARYLKPITTHIDQAIKIPNTPLLSEIFLHSLQDWPSKVIFKGWNSFQRQWKQWVESLAQKYGSIWHQTGIFDAIMSSTYEMRFNPDLVTGLVEFWCPETNTFVYPWGEATMTLEDMMILGGFPVVGEEITFPLSEEELVGIERELTKRRAAMCKSRAKKAGHSSWIKHFMEEETESEFEHVGFLSLWLSRYVFPSLAQDTIGSHVFPIAIALSRGKPISLAPAVLASLYRDMRLLTEKGRDFEESICVSAPFQLLQLWAFEHFPLLGPISPNSLSPGEPRVARWNKLNLETNLPLVRSALQLVENFRWRPYAADVENWRHPLYYKGTEQLLIHDLTLDVELRSFYKCLMASELVGVDCREKYLPHRVAMQFGFDQDLPADICDLNFSGENVRFFVPPRSFQPGVSGRYIKWWKEMMISREGRIKDVLVQKRNEVTSKLASLQQNGSSVASKSRSNSQASTKSCSKGKKRLSDCSGDDLPKVSTRPVKKSKISSSVEAKKSKGGCRDSTTSTIQKGHGKLSQVSSSLEGNGSGEDFHGSVASESPANSQASQKSRREVMKRLFLCDSSEDDLPNVSTKPAIKSKTPSSVRAKKSKGVSVASTILEVVGKSYQVSTKSNTKQNHESDSHDIPSVIKEQTSSGSSDDDHRPIATSINRSNEERRPYAVTARASVSSTPPPMKSKLSSSVSVSNASVAPTSGGKSSQISTKLNSKLNQEFDVHDIPIGAKENIPSDSIDEDDLPIAMRLNRCSASKSTGQDFSCNQSQNVVFSTSTIAKENDGKRKLNLLEQVTEKPADGVAGVVKTEEGCSFNEPIVIEDELNEEMKLNQEFDVHDIPIGAKENIPSDSIDEDDLPIATRLNRCSASKSTGQDFSCNQSQNVVFSTSTIAKENDGKRKLNLPEEVTEKPANGVAEVVKTEECCSFNEPIVIEDELDEEMKPGKKARESVKGADEGGKRRKAGESMGNPIDIDNYMDIATSGFQKASKDYLESRVEKLEKLLGVIPD